MNKHTSTSKKQRPTPRRQRRDAGSRRSKSRDTDILRLGAEQTFVRFDTVGVWLAPDYTLATAVPPQSQLEDTTPSAKRAWPQDLRHRLMAVSRLMRKLLQQGYVEIIQPWNDQPPWFRMSTAKFSDKETTNSERPHTSHGISHAYNSPWSRVNSNVQLRQQNTCRFTSISGSRRQDCSSDSQYPLQSRADGGVWSGFDGFWSCVPTPGIQKPVFACCHY